MYDVIFFLIYLIKIALLVRGSSKNNKWKPINWSDQHKKQPGGQKIQHEFAQDNLSYKQPFVRQSLWGKKHLVEH